MSDDNVVFEEEQRFRQPWLWVLFAMEAALIVGLMVKHPPPPAVIVLLVLVVGIPFLMLLFCDHAHRSEIRQRIHQVLADEAEDPPGGPQVG